jgi:hypothetical protein
LFSSSKAAEAYVPETDAEILAEEDQFNFHDPRLVLNEEEDDIFVECENPENDSLVAQLISDELFVFFTK